MQRFSHPQGISKRFKHYNPWWGVCSLCNIITRYSAKPITRTIFALTGTLAQGRKCHDRDSNPHSAEQKLEFGVLIMRQQVHVYLLKGEWKEVCEIMRLIFVISTMFFARCYGAFSSHSHKHRAEPLFFFLIRALGSFTCVTQHMGPTALCPIQRTKQWLSVMAGDFHKGIRHATF